LKLFFYLGLSLSNKHQDFQLYHLTSNNYWFHQELGSLEKIDSLSQQDLEKKLNSSNFIAYKWVVFDNIEYHLADMITLNKIYSANLPSFAEIERLILIENKLIFICKGYLTLEYIDRYRSFSIVAGVDSMKIYFCDLKNKFPSNIYRRKHSTLDFTWQLISLKYPIE